MAQAILRLPAVEEATDLKKWTIYQKIKQGTFPRPVKLGPNSVGWLDSEVGDWQEKRIAERDGAKREPKVA